MDLLILTGGLLMLSVMVVTGLTLIASGDGVRQLIDRCFVLLVAIPEMLRNGCARVITAVREFLANAAKSVGLTGEHTIQRVVGGVVLTLCTLLGVAVTALTLVVTLMGVMGSADNGLIDLLPLGVDTLMALELVAATILFGLLFFDVIGVTHITKFFAGETLSPAKKYSFGALFAAGLVVCISLLGAAGYIRGEALLSDMNAPAPAAQAPASVYVPGETVAAGPSVVGTVTADPPMTQGYIRAMTALMVGIPAVSAVAGATGFVGILPLIGLLIKGFVFVLTVLTVGIGWLMGHVGAIIVNHLYNLAYRFYDLFIQAAEGIKARFSKATPPQDIPRAQQGDNAPQAPQQAARPAAEGQHAEASAPKDDPNWNPLA
jgi:hypothetical protein